MVQIESYGEEILLMTKQEYDIVMVKIKEYPLWMKIAYTLWGEARNQKDDAKIAVAKVMLRRERDNQLWNDILAPYQFSCWNRDDPNLEPMLRADIRHDGMLRKCIEIAFFVIDNFKEIKDLPATNYHDISVNPVWAAKMTYLTQIGAFKFYKENV